MAQAAARGGEGETCGGATHYRVSSGHRRVAAAVVTVDT